MATSTHTESARFPVWGWVAIVFGVLVAGYGSTLPTRLTDADAGEFLVIAARGGIAHPPGYPLYVLLLRLLAAVTPDGRLVFVTAAASAVMTALAGALLVHGFRRQVAPWAMSTAVVLTGFTPAVWRQANAAEPFAMLLLLAACVLHVGVGLLEESDRLDAASTRNGRAGRLAALGLLFGFGFVSHQALALMLAVPLAVLLQSARTAQWQRALPITAAVLLAGFMVGALPALLLLQADTGAPLVYGDWSAPGSSQLLRHLLRRDYGTFTLAAGVHAAYGESLVAYLRALPEQLLYVGLALLPAALPALWRWPRAIVFGVVGSVLLAGPIFLYRVNLSPVEEPVVVARFFALPTLLLTPVLGAGLAWLAAARLPRWGAGVLFAMTVVIQTTHSRTRANRAAEDIYERHVRQLLEVAGRSGHSVLVSASDLHDYGLTYGQAVLGHASGVPVMMVGLMNVPWYRARFLAANGGSLDTAANVVRLLDSLNTTQLLVLADAPEQPRPAFFARAVPLGGAYVVTPPQAALPSWPDIYRANVELEDEFPVLPDASRRTRLTGWEARILRQHRSHLAEVCEALAALSHPDNAACRRRVSQYDDALVRLEQPAGP